MATCRAIVNGALRKLGRLAAGREPRTADTTDALAALQGLYLSWVASGAFGRLADVVPLVDCTAGENQRIVRDASVVTVTLPDRVPAYASPLPYGEERVIVGTYDEFDANTRPPRDGAVVQIADEVAGEVETWIYDGTLRQWGHIDALQLDDQAPRSVSDPEGLSATLAIELADTFGADVGPATLAQAGRYKTAMTHNYSGPRRAVTGVYV